MLGFVDVVLRHGHGGAFRSLCPVVARRRLAKIYKRLGNRVKGFAIKIRFFKFQKTPANRPESRVFFFAIGPSNILTLTGT